MYKFSFINTFDSCRYEKIFGKTFLCPGGVEVTAKFCARLNLQENQKVLDVGCGTGGNAFYMARNFGALVYGVDLSTNMIGYLIWLSFLLLMSTQ